MSHDGPLLAAGIDHRVTLGPQADRAQLSEAQEVPIAYDEVDREPVLIRGLESLHEPLVAAAPRVRRADPEVEHVA